MSRIFKRKMVDRSSQRLTSHPGLYSCAVRYSMIGDTNQSRYAQFGDISETGMKLISTKPHQTEVGAIIDVNYSLAGSAHEVSRKARVVRQGNEFVLGLQFLHQSEEHKYALWQHARYVSGLPWTFHLKRVSKWFKEHKLGLRIAMTAMTFFVFTATVIYLFSDEFAGRKQAWGEVYSDEIDLNYVKGFTQQK